MEESTNVKQSVEQTNDNADAGKKTYSTEEINQMMEEARKEEREKAEKREKDRADARIREAERLRNMSAEEQYKYQLEQREKLIEEKEKALTLAENKTSAMSVLADKGLAPSLVDLVVDTDADVMKSRIDLLDKAFKTSLKIEIEKRLAGNSPRKNLPPTNEITKEKFRKMSMAELTQLKHENPELYEELRGN